MNSQLFGNASKKIINVPRNAPMGGYIERVNGDMGVHDELYTRCLTLYDGKTKLVIISNDLLETDMEITLCVRKAINEKFLIPCENIMLCSTHTHSGPAITKWDMSAEDYIENQDIKKLKKEIAQTIIDNALMCINNLKPVNIGLSKSECREVAGNRVEENSISDYSVNTIRIADKNNDVIALVFNYACHPTVLGADNLFISADFPGSAARMLEKHFLKSTALFINGACGNQSTRFTRKSQDFNEVERIGTCIYESVISALSNMKDTNEFIKLGAAAEKIKLPVKSFPPREVLVENLISAENDKNNAICRKLSSGEIRLALTRYQGARILLSLSEILDKSGYITGEIQIFRVGNIEIVGVPVELFVEYGIEIKSKSLSSNTIIAGYANEVLGYVYTKNAALRGGYEVYASPFSIEAGKSIVEKALEMERKLF